MTAVVSLSNPHETHSYKWWLHESAICAEDRRTDAACTALRQAIEAAGTDNDRAMAELLLEMLTTGNPARRNGIIAGIESIIGL